MGLLKIFAILIVPVSAMTYAAASLGKQLPKASRWFGNYIGLNYVYFKSILKVLKPQDEIPYQMIDLARKASQQSEALRRELRNTVKKAKQQLQRKNQQMQTKIDKKIKQSKGQAINNLQVEESTQNQLSAKKNKNQLEQEQNQQQAITGSQIMRDLERIKEQLQTKKKLKKQSKKFYENI